MLVVKYIIKTNTLQISTVLKVVCNRYKLCEIFKFFKMLNQSITMEYIRQRSNCRALILGDTCRNLGYVK